MILAPLSIQHRQRSDARRTERASIASGPVNGDNTARPSTPWEVEIDLSRKMRDLELAKEAAEAHSRAMNALLAEFAHDICSPLSAIFDIAEQIRAGDRDGEWGEDVNTIMRISDHVLDIVRDMLDVAMIEARREVPRIGVCDLETLIRDVVEITRRKAEHRGLELCVLQDPRFPKCVQTDAPRLRRILVNILDNAVKYTRQGSIILLLDVADSGDPSQARLVFQVQDTGIGIARADQARIFEPFVRVAGTGRPTGAGLGLSIASQLTKLLGGTTQVESAPGAGSCFRIELPVAHAQE